ncbi:hypothetical protein ACOSP7_019638 [Xanthoceras sorbifolium]
MVDAVVSHAVERLGDFLIINEAVFLGVRNEVLWLKVELSRMQSFLKDADEKQYKDDRISNWVSEICSVCCCIFHKEVRNMHKKLGQFKDRIKKLTGRGVQYELQDSGNGEEERSNSLCVSRFDCCVCVYVSQDYTTGDILLAIILSLGFDNIRTEDLGKINETSLANTLHKSLQQRSYFVVIDDVRDAKVWESLRRAFPDENGGRVIITIRIKEISWELFSVQVFRNCNPDEGLEKLGKEMVLGGILSRKEPHKWCEVSDSTQIHPVLSSSFDSLPRQLKLCFLYLSSFPEDLELKIEKLIQLLVAEAFIPQVKDYDRISTYGVHDLIRNLTIAKAKENFLVTYDEVKHSNISPTIFSLCLPLRSLFLYGEHNFSLAMCKRFSSLRILFDGYIDNDYVTRKLIHLKYLGLKNSFIFFLSSIVFNLPRLQSLDVPHSVCSVDLPVEIFKSQELRHLIGNFRCVPGSIECLMNLQTIRSITNKVWTEIRTIKLINLRELWLQGPLISWAFSFDSMTNLTSLQILSIELRLKGKIENLPEDMHEVLPNLQCLSLRASLLEGDLMLQLEKLPNLIILHLGCRFHSGKKMMCTANGFLGLQILLLDENKFQIEELQVEEGALPRLKGLRIPVEFKSTILERLRSLPTPDPNEYSTKPPDNADMHSNERYFPFQISLVVIVACVCCINTCMQFSFIGITVVTVVFSFIITTF